TWLAPEHKTGETKGVVGQVAGLVSLLLALVLGTLIGVSFAYYSGQRTNLENFSAQILGLIRRWRNSGRRPSRCATSSRRESPRAMRPSGAVGTLTRRR